jgi:hypothetical protein
MSPAECGFVGKMKSVTPGIRRRKDKSTFTKAEGPGSGSVRPGASRPEHSGATGETVSEAEAAAVAKPPRRRQPDSDTVKVLATSDVPFVEGGHRVIARRSWKHRDTATNPNFTTQNRFGDSFTICSELPMLGKRLGENLDRLISIRFSSYALTSIPYAATIGCGNIMISGWWITAERKGRIKILADR